MTRAKELDEFIITREQLIAAIKYGKKLNRKTIVILKEVCVDGKSQAEVARKHKVHQQMVSRAKNSLVKRIDKMNATDYKIHRIILHPSLEGKLSELMVKNDELINKERLEKERLEKERLERELIAKATKKKARKVRNV